MNSFLAETLAGRTAIALPYCQANGTHVQVLDEGVIRFEPRDPDGRELDLVVSCGVHGNETAPVELVDRLIAKLLCGELRPKARVLFVIGNIEALRRGIRYVDEDMNRQFCRVPDVGDGPEARRAAMLEMQLARFFAQAGGEPVQRVHYDLHTAIHGSLIEKFAIHPQPAPGKDFDRTEIARLGLAGVSAVLLQSAAAPTFSLFSSRYCQASAFTIELGRAMPFGQNQQVDLSQLEAYLCGLIEGEQPAPMEESVVAYRVAREIVKQTEAFRLTIDGETDNFTPLAQGMTIAEDGETRWVIDEQDARIVFPNPNVAVGQRAGLIVVPATPD
ncbi:succinylglutamate desuccinylase [Jeongeupia naejangsanensis]|uniref:Succinylglutamate desuccinylase n=1 Tax=Jeongeupia naejangsanensis TaxID=613195 RepID=A0ABS2BJA2_9NEIS|nr:succinylglutamate desuccinylase [Jeongeupia naejangsanensis]MBM3115679.1 succinylglutamate desuccinylase [Jeongeupia naejangsanensis]